ncbi:hypothetical protein [Cupriavidus sp. EM10]|uniref:hypothetical protein n=1 Tax=Cupriavidus sp. EM10 TaxID=2839983 RepID=UPI001CECF840|nr:hypothetical protein [Cupriavidus sp. EM10]
MGKAHWAERARKDRHDDDADADLHAAFQQNPGEIGRHALSHAVSSRVLPAAARSVA